MNTNLKSIRIKVLAFVQRTCISSSQVVHTSPFPSPSNENLARIFNLYCFAKLELVSASLPVQMEFGMSFFSRPIEHKMASLMCVGCAERLDGTGAKNASELALYP